MKIVSSLVTVLCAAVLGFGVPSSATADIPYPPFSTCQISINQNPPRPACIANFEPDVIRLCPGGLGASPPVFDTATFAMTILSPLLNPISNATISLYEINGTVNIASGGATSTMTNSQGKATVVLLAGSGHGEVGVCADGVLICRVNVRSPDVATTATPTGCVLPTSGTSFVNSNDKSNTSCGFAVKFGPVTTGTNDAWDLNCDNIVNSFDTQGQLNPGFGLSGGWLQHFGHGAVLGAKTTCP